MFATYKVGPWLKKPYVRDYSPIYNCPVMAYEGWGDEKYL